MTTLVRWEPFREIAALQNDMGRLMSAFLGQTNGDTARTWIPAVDAWETENELVYAFDLPGIPEDKIAVEFDDGSLTVSGERERVDEAKNDGFYRFERRFGSFSRTVGLPQGVTEDDVSADYRDGVLEIKVAKPEKPKPRRIQVGSGERSTIEGTSTKA
jgi:HSP20 family protein